MNIWKNIKWAIFNHPPIGIRATKKGEEVPCDYCGTKKESLWHEIGYFCICAKCRKKVFDFVLKK